MAVAAVISPMPTSFVYEDLVSHVQIIQKQMIEIENNLANQLTTNQKLQNELKSRSLTFIDHMGYRTNHNCMDHERISEVVRKYKKNYIPKYLQQWIQFGTKKKMSISPLTDEQLKSTVSNFENGQEFTAYGKVIVWILGYEYPQLRLPRVSLTDSMEKIKMNIRKQWHFANIELKSCMLEGYVAPTENNWSEGTLLNSDDTILSSQLFQKNCVIMAKFINNEIAVIDSSFRYFDIYVRSLTGKTVTYKVHSEMDILTLKEMIQDKEGVPPDQERLFGRRLLEDGETLSDHSISEGDTVYQVLRLRGGMYHFTSGRQDFSRLPSVTAKAVKHILAINFRDINGLQQSPSELQKSLLQARANFAILYREIVDHTTCDDMVHLKTFLFPTPTDNDDASDNDSDSEDDTSNDYLPKTNC